MAISATAVWRIRTGGNIANGGLYDASVSSPGTNWSQQDSPQVTFNGTTVTATTAGVGATITITGYTVLTTDNGNGLKITGGVNFLTGWYTITSVSTGSNTWTLDRNCTSGAGTAMAGRMGGAVATLENISSTVVAGNTVYVRATAGNASTYPTSGLDYTLSAFFTPTPGSTAAGPVKWIGENGIPTIGSPGLGFYNMTQAWLEGLYIVATSNSNGTFGVVNGIDGCMFLNCVINQNNQAALLGAYLGGSAGCFFIGGEIYGGTASPTASSGANGVKTDNYGSVVYGAKIRKCRDNGVFSVGPGTRIENCEIYGCAGNGIDLSIATGIAPTSIINCTIDANLGHGILASGTGIAANAMIINNIITNQSQASKYGISVTDGSTALNDRRKRVWNYNNLYNNTSTYQNVSAGANDLTVDPQYVSAATGDFTPANTVLRGNAVPTGF